MGVVEEDDPISPRPMSVPLFQAVSRLRTEFMAGGAGDRGKESRKFDRGSNKDGLWV